MSRKDRGTALDVVAVLYHTVFVRGIYAMLQDAHNRHLPLGHVTAFIPHTAVPVTVLSSETLQNFDGFWLSKYPQRLLSLLQWLAWSTVACELALPHPLIGMHTRILSI